MSLRVHFEFFEIIALDHQVLLAFTQSFSPGNQLWPIRMITDSQPRFQLLIIFTKARKFIILRRIMQILNE
jgi:hypothetical protein